MKNRVNLVISIFLMLIIIIFLLYESFFLQFKLPIYTFYIITLIISILIILFIIVSKKILYTLFIIAFISLSIKEAFLSTVSPTILTPYVDNYVIYQLANGILNFSHIPFSDYYTGNAFLQTKQPLGSIFPVMFSELTGIQLNIILRHIGSIVGGFILPFSLILLYKPLSQNLNNNIFKFSWILFLFSPWIVFFLIWGHYFNYSIIYFIILTYILTKNITFNEKIKLNYSIIWIILIFALFLVHVYMALITIGIFLLIIILIYLNQFFQKNNKIYFNNIHYLILIYSIGFVIYLFWFAIDYVKPVVFMINYLRDAVTLGDPFTGSSYYMPTPKYIIPFYVWILRYLGVISWLLCFISSFYIIYKKYLDCKVISHIMIIFLSIGIIGLFTSLPYIFDPKYSTDLFNRSLYFLGLISAAPFVAITCDFLCDKKIKWLSIFSLILIINFGLIMTPIDFHNWNYPIRSYEDIRMNHEEWATAGIFTSKFIKEKSNACGLSKGKTSIGYYARINYFVIESSNNQIPWVPFTEWQKFKNSRIDYCYLTKSITEYEEMPGYELEKSNFEEFYKSINIVYLSGDVFIIYYYH